MRHTFLLLAGLVSVAVLGSGCANSEKKLGRGLNNTFEIVRWGEFRRTSEQTALFDHSDAIYGGGFVTGVNRTLARTGMGILEVVTFPFPPYDPMFTDTFTPEPAYPDNYRPGIPEDSMYATDTNLGFSGGDVAPLIPGSRFRIFDTH